MKLKEMLDRIQQHHPHMGEAEIVKRLNIAKDQFCEETEIVKTNFTFPTVANQRFYTLDSRIYRILSVKYNDVTIDRMSGEPPIYDDTTEAG